MMTAPRILLVVGGGIAAYKACELVRLIRKGGGEVTCVLTEGGSKFVTAMSLAALSENPVHTTLWDLKNEVEMGHIQLSRAADLVVVCPATADLLARMANGIADDLATTLLLATDKPVLAVPAMNVRMWQHEATIRNVGILRASGVAIVEPDEGAMACGEFGPGRLPEPPAIWHRIAQMLGIASPDEEPEAYIYEPEPIEPQRPNVPAASLSGLSASMITRRFRRDPLEDLDPKAVMDWFGDVPLPEDYPPGLAPAESSPLLPNKGRARAASGGPLPAEPGPLSGQPDFDIDPEHRPLFGKHILITAGPTHEPIDPVRYIANRSSGKQGFAIAAAAAAMGARVTLISGPVNLPTPPGVDRIDVETAREMADEVKNGLPADAAIMVAAVADWRSKDVSGEKIKKRGSAPPALLLTENPDILASVATSANRPRLLVGFAAETENILDNAAEKRKRKAVDWIIANDVSGDVMGGASNTVHIVTAKGVESLPEMPKEDVARVLVERIADAL
jgi:phosphopantothenoylcysteine decarboxylase/phosphopantothenate--cysteine ligase